VRSMYAGGLTRATRYTLPDLDGLDRDLALTRERGYALNLGEHVAEIRAIGIVVRGRQGGPVAALTAAGPSSRWERERLVALLPKLRETAAAIERDLREDVTEHRPI
jgi:DNA-binding IclR family transcriptional regulator